MLKGNKLISLVLIIIMLCGMIGSLVVSAEGETYDITYTKPANGSISLSVDGDIVSTSGNYTHTIPIGTANNITISANSGYRIASLTLKGISISEAAGKSSYSYNHNGTDNLQIAVAFEQIPTAAITVSQSNVESYKLYDNNTGAEIDRTAVVIGTSVRVEAKAKSGYEVSSIKAGSTALSSPYVFTVTGNTTVTISCSKQQVSLNVNITGEGTASPSNASYAVGTNVTVTFTPAAGYALGLVTVNDEAVTPTNNKYKIRMEENTVINVEFTPIGGNEVTLMLYISGNTDAASTVLVNGVEYKSLTTIKVESGSDVEIRVNPATGRNVKTFKVNNIIEALSNGSITLENVTASTTVTVDFGTIPVDTKKYTINASAGAGGYISPEGSVSVDEGTDKIFKIEANAGYEVKTVLVDGEEVNLSGGKYTFTNISENHSITVTFQTTGQIQMAIGVDDVNWSADPIKINITSTTLVDKAVLEKLKTDASGKQIIFEGVNYSWILPEGASFSTATLPDYVEFKVVFDSGSSYYPQVTSLMSGKTYKLITYTSNAAFPQGTQLQLNLGSSFYAVNAEYWVFNDSTDKIELPSGKTTPDICSTASDGKVTIAYHNLRNIVLVLSEEETVTVTPIITGSGSISPSEKQTVEVGTTQIFVITADEGFTIANLRVGDREIEDAKGKTEYTLTVDNIDENISIIADFTDKEMTEKKSGNVVLIVSLVLLFILIAGGVVLFMVKWKQEKY